MKLSFMSMGFLVATGLYANPIEETLSADVPEVLNVVAKGCPIEFIQGLRGAGHVGPVKYLADRSFQHYTITYMSLKTPENFEVVPVRTLEIHQTPSDEIQAAEAPIRWKYICTLKDLK